MNILHSNEIDQTNTIRIELINENIDEKEDGTYNGFDHSSLVKPFSNAQAVVLFYRACLHKKKMKLIRMI